MTIRYTLSPEDVGAFNAWRLRNMPDGKKAIQRAVGVLCAYICISCGLGYWNKPASASFYFFLAVVSIGLVSLLIPKLIIYRASKTVVKLNSSPENAGIFGERTLEINEDGVLSISANTTSLHKWGSINTISQSDTHAFLTVGTMMAIVISRETVREGNLDAFVAEAQRLHQQAKARIPIPAMAR